MRTSETHPLQIGTIPAGPDMGQVGITLCPGKHDPHAISGGWKRDLSTDLGVMETWGAAVVVTHIENEEMRGLGVAELGSKVCAGHMEWFHLPIVDMSVPDEAFEERWIKVGEVLRETVRSGGSVVFHCRGGLGRSGMVAARFLSELGWDAQTAINETRKVRPGAIETAAQEAVVKGTTQVHAPRPENTEAAIRDRATGVLLGLAVGDALGTTLEFSARDSHPRVTDIVGGGPFNLEPGQWTDDTAMAVALGESLRETDHFNERDLMDRFVAWYRNGKYSCTGACFDIGVATSSALQRFEDSREPVAGSTDPRSAGNGSLMRLAPVAIRYWGDHTTLLDVAKRQSATTHGAQEAVDACAAYAELLSEAIAGAPRHVLLKPRTSDYSPKIAEILNGSWRSKIRPEINSSGYVVHSMEAAVWCVARTTSFREAVVLAANLGGDADTVAAITGQLAGAIHGASGIPSKWLERLAWRDRLEKMADDLFKRGVNADRES